MQVYDKFLTFLKSTDNSFRTFVSTSEGRRTISEHVSDEDDVHPWSISCPALLVTCIVTVILLMSREHCLKLRTYEGVVVRIVGISEC